MMVPQVKKCPSVSTQWIDVSNQGSRGEWGGGQAITLAYSGFQWRAVLACRPSAVSWSAPLVKVIVRSLAVSVSWNTKCWRQWRVAWGRGSGLSWGSRHMLPCSDLRARVCRSNQPHKQAAHATSSARRWLTVVGFFVVNLKWGGWSYFK